MDIVTDQNTKNLDVPHPLGPGWMEHLGQEFNLPYMQHIREFLKKELKVGKVIYPHGKDIFNAFKATDFDAVKVVIIGQDPYHGPKQAHGLCFSVQKGVAIPPSLQNIYKEIEKEFGHPMPKHGCLDEWARQGVLLLNATLTVEESKPMSHSHIGWDKFTDKAVEVLNEKAHHLVFLLWGSHAQKKGVNIDRQKHLVLTSAHPSPLSAYRGFLGSNHFKSANAYLQENGRKPILWGLSN